MGGQGKAVKSSERTREAIENQRTVKERQRLYRRQDLVVLGRHCWAANRLPLPVGRQHHRRRPGQPDQRSADRRMHSGCQPATAGPGHEAVSDRWALQQALRVTAYITAGSRRTSRRRHNGPMPACSRAARKGVLEMKGSVSDARKQPAFPCGAHLCSAARPARRR